MSININSVLESSIISVFTDNTNLDLKTVTDVNDIFNRMHEPQRSDILIGLGDALLVLVYYYILGKFYSAQCREKAIKTEIQLRTPPDGVCFIYKQLEGEDFAQEWKGLVSLNPQQAEKQIRADLLRSPIFVSGVHMKLFEQLENGLQGLCKKEHRDQLLSMLNQSFFAFPHQNAISELQRICGDSLDIKEKQPSRRRIVVTVADNCIEVQGFIEYNILNNKDNDPDLRGYEMPYDEGELDLLGYEIFSTCTVRLDFASSQHVVYHKLERSENGEDLPFLLKNLEKI